MRDEEQFRRLLNRPITGDEGALIRWLLDHGQDGAGCFVSQIDNLTIASECTCGCPTIDFAQDESGEKEGNRHRLISDYLAIVDDQYVGVMLFATARQLSMLEVYSLAGTDKPFGLPEIQGLFPWDELRDHPIPSRPIPSR